MRTSASKIMDTAKITHNVHDFNYFSENTCIILIIHSVVNLTLSELSLFSFSSPKASGSDKNCKQKQRYAIRYLPGMQSYDMCAKQEGKLRRNITYLSENSNSAFIIKYPFVLTMWK